MFSNSLLQGRSSFHQSGQLPKLPPLILAVLLLMPLALPLLHHNHHLQRRGIHQISASSYIRWILDWSESSARCPAWPKTWLTISTTWVSAHPFLPSLSPLVPFPPCSGKYRYPLYFITLFFTAYIGDNVRFRSGGGLAMLLGIVLHFLFLISSLF